MRLDRFPWGSRTLLVGILNVTPDSFAGDGLLDPDAAARRGFQLLADGCDLLDVGGESTRPQFTPVPARAEAARIVPVIERLRAREPHVQIAVDTTKPSVAKAAFHAGADVLNDIHGLRNPKLAQLAAEQGVWVIAMHNQRDRPPAADPIAAALSGFQATLEAAERAGIEEEQLILDPGFGFGWTQAQHAELLRRLPELRALGRPLLAGLSRKRLTGAQFGWSVAERLDGSAAVTALAVAGGADLVRVHDAAPMARVVRMADAIVRP